VTEGDPLGAGVIFEDDDVDFVADADDL